MIEEEESEGEVVRVCAGFVLQKGFLLTYHYRLFTKNPRCCLFEVRLINLVQPLGLCQRYTFAESFAGDSVVLISPQPPS